MGGSEASAQPHARATAVAGDELDIGDLHRPPDGLQGGRAGGRLLQTLLRADAGVGLSAAIKGAGRTDNGDLN